MRGDLVDLGRLHAFRQHLRARFLQRAALHERLRLRQAVGEQQIVVMLEIRFVADGGGEEFDRDDVGALVQQLEEGVLAIGAGLAPDQRAGRRRRQRCRRA